MQGKGFFGALFDLSFSDFVTTKVIKFLYVLLLVFIAIGYLVLIVTGFARGFGTGLLYIVGGALAALLYVILARIAMETTIVLFRIADHAAEIARQGRGAPPQPPQAVQ